MREDSGKSGGHFSAALYQRVRAATRGLLGYCESRQWAGWDPYDALNSELFRSTPLANSKWCRLALTQILKRLPFNLRPLLAVPAGQNPKGVALFLSACLKSQRLGLCGPHVAEQLAQRLIELRSAHDLVCWGYDFDWQQRYLLVPKFTPNIICTSFGGNALLDHYEVSGKSRDLDAAVSAAQFLLTGLPIKRTPYGVCLSYTPYGESEVHNASLLGAAFLARVHRHAPRDQFLDTALQAARFSIKHQRSDGSWPYGEAPKQAWIDSFHTGYNLTALRSIHGIAPEAWIENAIQKGLKFYLDHFFENECVAKYYHDRTYPIDVHSIAQAILTLIEFRGIEPNAVATAVRVMEWALDHMLDPGGYFYFQKHPHYVNRIPYMRWSQAWMLLALSTLLLELWPQGNVPRAAQVSVQPMR